MLIYLHKHTVYMRRWREWRWCQSVRFPVISRNCR